MSPRSLIALALESAIAAELALFTLYLLSHPRRRTTALRLLAALSFCMGALVGGNLLIRLTGARWLPDMLLFLDLLAPPLVFLYVSQMQWKSHPLAPADGLHALPAVLGIAVWKAGLLDSMDLYVNLCWFGYLATTATVFVRRFAAYAPPTRQRFLALLLSALSAIWLLRLVIVAQATIEPEFREGLPYLFILTAIFGTTCLTLLTALRHPDLLSIPGSHVKYGFLPGGDAELDRLDERLATVFSGAPFLDPDFSLAELATLLGASERQVSQLINARHGVNVSAYINRHRVEFAAQLLLGSDKPIKAVPFEAGFRSKSVFNREFQRRFGMSPTAYRQSTTSGVTGVRT